LKTTQEAICSPQLGTDFLTNIHTDFNSPALT